MSNDKFLKLFRLLFIFIAFAGLVSTSFMALSSPSNAYASGLLDVSVEGGAYFQNLSGNLKVGNTVNGFAPTNITPSDIGLQTTKTEPMIKAVLSILYGNRLSLTYVPYVYGGSKILTQTVYFNGQPYNINTAVTSKLELYSYKLFYTHNFSLDNFVTMGVGTGIDVFTAKAGLDSAASGTKESKNANLPMPLIGGRVKISPLNDISFIGKFQGFTIGSDGYYYHIKAGVNYKAVGPLSVFADYVYDKIHVDVSNINGNLSFNGPEAGLRLTF
ncbi:MAG: hypothetical protein ACYDDB_07450 [bacterium]